jgi:hypothetical protein
MEMLVEYHNLPFRHWRQDELYMAFGLLIESDWKIPKTSDPAFIATLNVLTNGKTEGSLVRKMMNLQSAHTNWDGPPTNNTAFDRALVEQAYRDIDGTRIIIAALKQLKGYDDEANA